MPGLLANVLGIEIEEYEPLGSTVTNTIKLIEDNESAKVLLGQELVPKDFKEETGVRKEDMVWELPPYEIVIIKE